MPQDKVKENSGNLGLWAALASLGYMFWCLGGMEMVERLAFYGLRSLVMLYAVIPSAEGGLGITVARLGVILAVWSALQGFLPFFIGGLADKYGYKLMMGVSTLLKTASFVMMIFCHDFWSFLVSVVVLAVGTSFWVPSVQGAVAKATNPENSSLGWGLFYQAVNLGAFLSPLVAGYLRKMSWDYVFLACAIVGSVNLLILLTYKEPGREEREQLKAENEKKRQGFGALLKNGAEVIKDPKMYLFLFIFSGFYLLYSYMFDILPLHINDWVNSTDIVNTLTSWHIDVKNKIISFIMVLDKTGSFVQPEGMLNINCAIIMTVCFIFAYLSSKMKILHSISLGFVFVAASMALLGVSHMGWICALAVVVFTLGEMFSNVKFSEFVGNYLAPDDKKATYLGIAQVSYAVSATLEGYFGPFIYEIFSSKDTFARKLLGEAYNMNADQLEAIPPGEAFERLTEVSGISADVLTRQMYSDFAVANVWFFFGAIGLLTALAMFAYSVWYGRHAGDKAVKTGEPAEAAASEADSKRDAEDFKVAPETAEAQKETGAEVKADKGAVGTAEADGGTDKAKGGGEESKK
ncbi:MFS transporter [bacterium]|nr:MFS transporter [bacterium]